MCFTRDFSKIRDSSREHLPAGGDVVLGRSCVRMTVEKTEAIKPTIF